MRILNADTPGGSHGICGVTHQVTACRQAVVGFVQRLQKPGGALHGPALYDSTGIKPTPSIGQREVDRKRTVGLLLGFSPQLEHLSNLWRTFVDQQFASIQTVDDGIVSVGAEDAINFAQLADHFLSGLVTFGSGGVAAPQGKVDRHLHDVLDATMDTAVHWSLDCGAAHMPASPRAGCSDCRHPTLVIVVVRLTMSMLGSCNR
jgi:hypothetical protein